MLCRVHKVFKSLPRDIRRVHNFIYVAATGLHVAERDNYVIATRNYTCLVLHSMINAHVTYMHATVTYYACAVSFSK